MTSIKTILVLSVLLAVLVANSRVEAAGPPYAEIAKVLGKVLVKNTWYTKCDCGGVATNKKKCPDHAYGLGLNKGMAESAAKLYARLRHQGCQNNVKNCNTGKFTG